MSRTTLDDVVGSAKNYDIDQLTGLPKRLVFEEHLKNVADTDNADHALCLIDIDSFTVVNEVYGHVIADSLLVEITSLIKNKIDCTDLLARIGNDEFGLIINNCDLNHALAVTKAIREEIKTLRISDSYSVTVCIGVTMFNITNNNAEVNLKNVNVACLSAKQTGDKVQLYQGDDHFAMTYQNDMHLIDKIKSALEEDRFVLHAQEIMPLAVSEVIKRPIVFEVLLRMKDVYGNLIFPGEFLPITAKHKLTSRIDLMVIEKVITFLNNNLSFANRCSMIMVNLSAQSLGDDKILDYLHSNLKKSKFSPKILCFEITETEMINNISTAINFINLIRSQFGCRFALDDFGTGFCSFKYIRELPVDIIKLDGDFVKELNSEPLSHLVVQAVCDIAKLTHKKTIAEWVETKEVLDTAQDMGIDYGQGYFISYPMLLDDYINKFTGSGSTSS
ncbi:MAG: EAL domain-containing protein [Candidatus Thiodiazotropha sp.]